jgi:type IV fimbrial biogenesis protein FimT
MMTILIGAILVAIAVPGMESLSRRSQQVNAVGDVLSMLKRARSEAASRYQPVTVCVSTDGENCSANTTWESGWMMFVDLDGDQARAGAGEDILQVGGALPAGSTLAALSFNSASAITFAKGGTLTNGGTFRYCIADGATKKMKAVNVLGSGMTQLAADVDGDGKLEDNGGTAIQACP